MIETVPHIINAIHNGVMMAEWSEAHRFECTVVVVVRRSSPEMNI